MKAKNTIFFGEKGISSTSANHLANIAKESAERLQKNLKSVSFVNTSVSTLSSEPKIIAIGKDKVFLVAIEDALLKVSDLYSFCAWMREGIKAKEDELKSLEMMDLIEYSSITGKSIPEPVHMGLLMNDVEAIGSLNIAERLEYYNAESVSATIGKYIHPGNEFNTARDKLMEKISNPKSISGSTSDMLIYDYSPSCNLYEVEKTFFKLQSIHRTNESKLNSLKFKIKSIQDEYNLVLKKEYEQKLRAYNNEKESLHAEMNVYIAEEKEKLLAMKIIVPKHLENILKELEQLTK